MIENLIDELVPIFGIFMIIAIVIGPLWIRSYFAARERAQMHETLRVAYEKGQPVPPELIEKLTAATPRQNYGGSSSSQGGADADLRRAIVLIAVGLGLAGLGAGLFWGFMYVSPIPAGIIGGSVGGAGAIPGFIGLAYLVLWLARRGATRP